MGHRKYSAPRRGSVAFRPRARAKSLESRIRTWPKYAEEKTSLLGFAGFKAGGIHILTIDDREKTPNFGKHLLNPSTVIAAPPMKIVGIRAYKEDLYGRHAIFDVYAKDLPKELSRKFDTKYNEKSIASAEGLLDKTESIFAIVSISPNDANLSQKKPYVFEIPLSGKDIKSQYDYLKGLLGNEVHISDVFEIGQYIDVSGITRGKGIEGPITRFGVKRKQHKSRKSVRAVGTLGPISPAVVTYTVARQGQRGFHQRTEYNKRILIMSNTENDGEVSINPSGGFKHFGLVKGDYLVVRGSVPGVPKRLVKMRQPIRDVQKKIIEPKVIEVVVG
ncbi:MAG TPA: 50S ribosomal protein L3 [Nitrososphaeraceae archaeon]|jgi:large subunit ribosomal protein L3|nr:50S ribosomal protein L3 [Nitrososphaeraceae archaeon]